MRTIAIAAWAALAFGGGKVPWERDYAKGLEKAKKERRLVLLCFADEGCDPCGKLARGVFSDDGAVKAVAESVVPVYVDCTDPQKNKEVQDRYRVQGHPTVLLVDPAIEEPVADLYPEDARKFAADIRKHAAEHAKKK